MNTTHSDGNQQPSGLRGDPGAVRTSGDDTRDPVSASSEKLSGAARALVEQSIAILNVELAYPDDIQPDQLRVVIDRLTELSALLAQAQTGEIETAIDYWRKKFRAAEAERVRMVDCLNASDAALVSACEQQAKVEALLAQAGAPTAHLEKELEAAKADAIHGWSEVDHQKAHKEEYMRMLEVAEAEIARLRGEAGAPETDKDDWTRVNWVADHVTRHGRVERGEQYYTCACGGTFWHDGKSSARPREESQS